MRSLCSLLTLSLLCQQAIARVNWALNAGIGAAYGSVNSRIDKDESQYKVALSPRITPVVSIVALFTLSRKLFFETGLQYSGKSFRGINNFVVHDGSNNIKVLFDTRYKLHYLTLPLILDYTLIGSGNHRFLLGGGMAYSFLLNGSSDYFTRQQYNTELYEGYYKNNPVSKGLVQTKNTYTNTMSIFDVSIRLQVSYLFRSRLMLRLFQEQSLYSVYLKEPTGKPAVKLRYTGLSIGIILPKLKTHITGQ